VLTNHDKLPADRAVSTLDKLPGEAFDELVAPHG
jgi:hypothetical protein